MENTKSVSPIAANVAANVRRLRGERGWSLARLSEALDENGHSLGLKTLSKIETGDRGIGVDDLAAFAEALGAEVEQLMLPPLVAADREVEAAFNRWRTFQIEYSEARREMDRRSAEADEQLRRAVSRHGDEGIQSLERLLRSRFSARVAESILDDFAVGDGAEVGQ